MKKVIFVSVGLGLIFSALNIINAGQVTTDQTSSSAKKITVSGEIDMPMVSRDDGINRVLDNNAEQDGDTLWLPLITINLDADVGDKISGFLQLQNERLVNNNAISGTAANVNSLGGDNIPLSLKQALVKLEKFVIPELTFTYGLQNLKIALREGEGGFFLDTGNASSNAINRFLTSGVLEPRSKSTDEFSGFRFDYGSLKDNNYQAVLFIGKITDTTNGINQLSNDTKLNGAVAWYKLDNKVFNALLSQILNSKNNTNIQTIGVGANYPGLGVPDLNGYLEYYSQTGDFAVTRTVVAHSASAYRAGVKYDIQHTLKPYVDLSYWFLSGGGTAKTNKKFVSLENVKSTMILEDEVFGLDLDSDYTAIKVKSGISTNVDIDKDGSPEELKVTLLIGQFTKSGNPPATSRISDKLGTEIDLIVTLQYTPSLGFTFGYATLDGAKFFKTAYPSESSMQMIVFGAALKF
jgi:hypothetical protein